MTVQCHAPKTTSNWALNYCNATCHFQFIFTECGKASRFSHDSNIRDTLHSCSTESPGSYAYTYNLNPSVWSDGHCSSQSKHHLSWSDNHWSSCCTLSLIRIYLDTLGSKCNRAALCLFVKELALFRCGRQFLEIISSFFLCSQSLSFLFAVPNFTDGFLRPSNSGMKQGTNVIAIITQLSYVALKWCMTSHSCIKGLFVLDHCVRVWISFEPAVRCNDGVQQEVFVGRG